MTSDYQKCKNEYFVPQTLQKIYGSIRLYHYDVFYHLNFFMKNSCQFHPFSFET